MRNHTLIPQATVLQVHPSTSRVLQSWGAGRFAMPHSITIDWTGEVWITDVGLHQVSKFNRSGDELLTLGTAWEPGSDAQHFCKPTDVAVLPDGDAYVSDGYCNSRVVRVVAPPGAALRAAADTPCTTEHLKWHLQAQL